MDQKQEIQSKQYSFPYHYLPQIRNDDNPTYFRYWGFSESYCAAIVLAKQWLQSVDVEHDHVDIGCGDGGFIYHISKYFPNIEFTGIDYDEQAIRWANMFNTRHEFIATDISIEHGDRLKSSYKTASLIEVIEHLPPSDIEVFIESTAELISPGGQLFVTVPHVNKKLQAKHFQHFTFKTIAQLFDKQFDVLSIKGFESYSLFWKLYRKLTVNRLWFIDIPLVNRFSFKNTVSNLSDSEKHCGRIMLILVKKT